MDYQHIFLKFTFLTLIVYKVKKEWGLVALAHPNASLDGLGVALKVKVSQSNDDEAC